MELLIIITMIIIAAIFLILTIYYIYASIGKIKYLNISKFTNNSIDIKIMGIPIDQPLQELVNQLNVFVEQLNRQNKRVNIASSIAAGIGFLSSIVTIYQLLENIH